MSILSFAIRDSATMFRRDVRHSLRYLPMTLSGVLTPTIFLVLFNYVFGGTIGAGLDGAAHGGAYIDYLAPGIIALVIASGCASTAVNLVTDMNEGIITRFRTMAISRGAVLTGTVLGSLLRTVISVGLVLGVAVLMGFRPSADPTAWIAVAGLVMLFTFGITWMGVLFGLVGGTPAGANSLSLLFQLLGLTSSALVSTASMPAGVRWYAEYQPFTPVVNTLRGLLLGTSIGTNTAVLAVAWCLVLALVGYLLSRATYSREPARP